MSNHPNNMRTIIQLILGVLLLSVSAHAQQKEAMSFAVKSPKETFVGAVLYPQTMNEDLHQFVSIKVPEKITVSSSLPVQSKEMVASYDNMMATIMHWVKNSKSSQIQKFSYHIVPISSHNELNGYFGQKVKPSFYFDISNDRPFEEPTFVMSISQELFSVYMDIPNDGRLYPNDPEVKTNGNNMLYVNQITFGRKAIVLVHSIMDYLTVKKSLEYILSSDSSKINSQSLAFLANANMEIMIVGNPDIESSDINNPLKTLIEYFKRPISTRDFGVPISFSASYLKDHSTFCNPY